MTLTAPISALRLVLEDVDLGPGTGSHDLGHDLGVLQLVPSREHLALVIDDKQRGKEDLALAAQAIDVDDVARLDFELPAACANDGVHGHGSFSGWNAATS